MIRELSHYIYAHPDEQMALMPVYDAARDHAQRGTCTHSRRCPLVTTSAVVVDERNRVLSLRHEGAFALAEAEPEEQDDSLGEAALRLLAEAVGIRDVWTEPDSDGPFLIDVTRAGQHGYGPRLRIGFRYLFRAHSGAIAPMVIEAGAAAWMPLGEIGIPSVRDRLHGHLVGTPSALETNNSATWQASWHSAVRSSWRSGEAECTSAAPPNRPPCLLPSAPSPVTGSQVMSA